MMTKLGALTVQIAALLLISQVASALAAVLKLPLPGSLLGMLLLLGLLGSGLVPLGWIEASATLLTRHLAFFFIPLAVGLVGFTDLFRDNGVAITVTLVVSAGVGIGLAGLSSQRLAARKEHKTP